ncbi:MAG: hypothetical protein EON52_28495 [Actinomycetales bacterium]|nr:MAG: hypothetical protein EON52_28495 [Actinomycetales bacterium]
MGGRAALRPRRLDRRWQLVVPALDVVAICLLRIAQPDAGFGIIMVIPVLWLASARGRLGIVLGSSVPAVVLLSQVALERNGIIDPVRPASLPATGSIILTLALMSGVLAASYERLRAQRSLLFQQSAMLEDALDSTRVEESALRSIMNVVPFAVVTFDAEGQVTHSNQTARDLFARFGVGAGTPWEDVPLFGPDGSTHTVGGRAALRPRRLDPDRAPGLPAAARPPRRGGHQRGAVAGSP